MKQDTKGTMGIKRKILGAVIVLVALALFWQMFGGNGLLLKDDEPIKVGILHSLSGTMASSESSVVDATLLAIEEINQTGGLLGREIRAVVVDGRSDWPTFAKEAERLILEEKVSVIFGCWTSASRKEVKPVVEKYNHLLFYPVQYEGLEESENIIYTGAAPNQQIIPAIKWSFDNIGKRFFLVGSDYVFPRAANAIIKDLVFALGGEIVGEEYLLLGSREPEDIIQKIVEVQPGMIINTLNGDSNETFFKKLIDAGITSDKIPTLSFSIAEEELRSMGTGNMAGNYAAWNYFQSIDTPENREFVKKIKKKYGADRVTTDPMEAAYFGVKIWAQAVEEAGVFEVNEVRREVKSQNMVAPEGMIYINRINNHTWKTVRIGKIRADGQFDIVWSSGNPVKPTPYPFFREKPEWETFLQNLYEGWGKKWANTGK